MSSYQTKNCPTQSYLDILQEQRLIGCRSYVDTIFQGVTPLSLSDRQLIDHYDATKHFVGKPSISIENELMKRLLSVVDFNQIQKSFLLRSDNRSTLFSVLCTRKEDFKMLTGIKISSIVEGILLM